VFEPGHDVKDTLQLQVEHPPRFVSRGGEKLLAGLDAFPISVKERICLDGGISTGGFTDCLLQHGAKRVYGVDVGYGQTAWSLRTDDRVVLRERTNLRHLQPEGLYGEADPWPTLAVTDVSFISLRLILPAMRRLLHGSEAEALVLVKPQFEVGRDRVGRGGVVRDPAAHCDAIDMVITAAEALDWHERFCFRPVKQATHRRQDQTQRNKRHIRHRQGGPRICLAVQPLRLEVAQVGPLPQDHPIVGAQTPSRLSISNIHAINPFGTVLQQTVGETSGGDAAIQTNTLLHRNRKGVQSRQ
jgi:TlyA family rRNA methyltransferase/putative hemolysin